jgi:hypothetical protein
VSLNLPFFVVGQTGRSLTTRYKEHIRSIRLNKDESAFAQHILNKQHQYGPMTVIMEMIEKAKKGEIGRASCRERV